MYFFSNLPGRTKIKGIERSLFTSLNHLLNSLSDSLTLRYFIHCYVNPAIWQGLAYVENPTSYMSVWKEAFTWLYPDILPYNHLSPCTSSKDL